MHVLRSLLRDHNEQGSQAHQVVLLRRRTGAHGQARVPCCC